MSDRDGGDEAQGEEIGADTSNMAGRHILGLGLATIFALSACSPNSELRDAVEADRENDGTRLDGIDDGWYREITPEWQIRLASPETPIVLVEGLAFGEQTIESFEPLGAFDAACLDVAIPFAEVSAGDWELDMLFWGRCGNCESSFVALIEVEDGVARSIGSDAAIEVLEPIDTEDEVRIVFDAYDLIRSTEDGWEVIRIDTPPCSTEDTPHGRWSVSFAGQVTELESYVVPGDTGGGGTCD